MSRYYVETDDEFMVFVGWDNPLQTFFYQQYIDYDLPGEKIVEDFGTSYKEIPTVNELAHLLDVKNYRLTIGQLNSLIKDYEMRTEPTPLQRMINRMFES